MNDSPKKYTFLVLSNSLMALMWLRVLWNLLFITFLFFIPSSSSSTTTTINLLLLPFCETRIRPSVHQALYFSFLELIQIFLGIRSYSSSSPILLVLFFILIRCWIEFYFSTFISCVSWQHISTLTCWSLGESIRFLCFTLDSIYYNSSKTTINKSNNTKDVLLFQEKEKKRVLSPTTTASSSMMIFKTIRYQVGCILFPIGATCEFFIVYQCATFTSRKEFYILSFLWPIGFIPFIKQLFKQRRKHFLFLSSLNHDKKEQGGGGGRGQDNGQQGGRKNVFV